MIYEYDNYIHYLKDTLKAKSKTNPSYSLRAFAKKLDLSPGALSLILNKKKNLSVARAYEVAQFLELDTNETEYFTALIQLESAKSETLRLQILEKIKNLNPNIKHSKNLKQTILTLEHFKLISEWYGLAILELISGIEKDWTSKDIAKKLSLSKLDVDLTLERLIKLELIEETNNGIYKRVAETLMIESQIPSDAIRKYYEGVHEKSRLSIREQRPNEKVIGAQVFSFDLEQLEDVRKLTDDYLNALNELAALGKNKTEVYQAIANVFRLSN